MKLTIGQKLTYNDGREGHQNVHAEVIALIPNGFVAQFEDRYAPTTIMFADKAWMDYIRFQ